MLGLPLSLGLLGGGEVKARSSHFLSYSENLSFLFFPPKVKNAAASLTWPRLQRKVGVAQLRCASRRPQGHFPTLWESLSVSTSGWWRPKVPGSCCKALSSLSGQSSGRCRWRVLILPPATLPTHSGCVVLRILPLLLLGEHAGTLGEVEWV